MRASSPALTQPPVSSKAHKSRILVVDADEARARDIASQLAQLRYDPVGLATRGTEAIALAGELRPDLVLMNIELAGDMDGITAAQVIRTQFALPVVLLTAYAEEGTLARAVHAEPFGYIIKPFSPRELHVVLELALFKHKAEARLLASEEEYRLLFEGMLDGFALHEIVCDAAGRPVDYRFLSVNPASNG